jgi:serine protease Do
VGLADGRSLEGRVVGRDPKGDIALVRIDVDDVPAAVFGDSSALVPGAPVVALGNPFGLSQVDHDPSVTFGVVSATHRYQGGEKVYGDAVQIDAPVNPGNSGGPLFGLDGKLVGINGRIAVRQGLRHNVGVGFAIPVHQVLLVLDRLKRGEQIVRGWLGVRFVPLGDGTPGVVVRDVVPGSPAEAAGVLDGDRVVAIDGRPVDQPMRLQNALSVLPAGAKVRLRLLRDGAQVEVVATLAERRER